MQEIWQVKKNFIFSVEEKVLSSESMEVDESLHVYALCTVGGGGVRRGEKT